MMYFDDADKEIVISAPLDLKAVLSINGALILIIGLMPSYWMNLSVSLF
jgi:NADH-quinone oxidoreductase subunit N